MAEAATTSAVDKAQHALMSADVLDSHFSALKVAVVRALCDRLHLEVLGTGRSGGTIKIDYVRALVLYVRSVLSFRDIG